MIELRSATVEDAAAIREIYAPYVLHTSVTFEREVPTVEEFRRRIAHTLERFPYLLAVEDGEVMAYCYASPVNERPSAWLSAQLSVYVRQDCRGRGLGRLLYTELERLLRQQGITNLYALVAAPVGENPHLTMDSPRFHAAMGYTEVGRLHRCGEKFGLRMDLTYWEKILEE